jgi:two-component system, OmpR family, phosphate regulon sensor histidine kinase PhoR
MLGLRSPEDLGKPVTNLLRGPDFASWLAVQGQVKSPLEMRSPRNDNVWLSVTAIPFQEHQRLVILRDNTEIHNVEQIRRDFVANISHELRTPLTVLQGYLELLQENESSEVSEAVARMLAQTAQMQMLLEDLLELSRLQSDEIQGEEQAVDVPGMLMQLKEQADELSRGRHELVFDVAPGPWLSGIASDLESAFGNLISNAIKYTPDGGTISVSWQDSEAGPQLSVRDTGIGIPGRDIPRLTERFYRVGSDRARQTGGTGLGLAIVKHVLNAHQATLKIESELGEGSVFTCTFPPERRHDRAPPVTLPSQYPLPCVVTGRAALPPAWIPYRRPPHEIPLSPFCHHDLPGLPAGRTARADESRRGAARL